ncbi:universal stress protein [Noviherbaspirillum suwonense]|uniref:universal stress protein n=1 Tax=Noviherbaspirillum suwonense TaxID=1224511 RepID=UPI0024B75AFC|nr:universal stress protein [Noviherbaspirillum suwonense]
MNILIAADGSTYTIKAAEYVASKPEFLQAGSQLHVFHAEPPITSNRAKAVLGAATVDNYYKTECEAALAPAENVLREKNIAFHSAYAIGAIPEEIQKYAEKHSVDLIVMGSHGHTALRNLVLGSNATKVLALTTLPVLIVR